MQELLPPNVNIHKLVDNLAFAVKMTWLPDGRLLITEKTSGVVRLIESTFKVVEQPVVDLAVNSLKERGLLGITAHPDFEQNKYVYIYYVAPASPHDSTDREDVSGIHIARFRLSGIVADAPPQTIIALPYHPGPYHIGGCILFGPDRKLYVSVGELNHNANLYSQLKHSPRGKLLRYNDDGTIPPDNPFGPDSAVFVYGVRNVFGFAFDNIGSGLFISDNGPKGHDELSKGFAGENLGWPLIWGIADTWYERIALRFLGERYRSPFWETFEGHAAPTAVQVIPNDLYGPQMRGRILMSEFVRGQVRQFSLDETIRSHPVGTGMFVEDVAGVVDLQFGPDGKLYILTINALYRVDPVSNTSGH